MNNNNNNSYNNNNNNNNNNNKVRIIGVVSRILYHSLKIALASGKQLLNNAPYIFINRLKGRNVLVQHKAHNQ